MEIMSRFGLNHTVLIMMETASKLSRRELDELCSQYQNQLEGPIRHQQLAINYVSNYFSNIPESERTPEMSALEEVFLEVENSLLQQHIFDDLERFSG